MRIIRWKIWCSTWEIFVPDIASLWMNLQFGGRLGLVCQQTYNRADFAGYLEMGVPPAYGAGAAEVIRDVVENQTSRHKLVNELLRPGDIERAITEWRSLLRQIVHAPDYDWDRWRA